MRGFAKSLLDKGANVAVISKVLGHSDISVTTKYMYLEDKVKKLEEELEAIRKQTEVEQEEVKTERKKVSQNFMRRQ